jgi:hypothetical protein
VRIEFDSLTVVGRWFFIAVVGGDPGHTWICGAA